MMKRRIWPRWSTLCLACGGGLAALGIALNETGIDAGRPMLMAGVPLLALGGLWALRPQRPAPDTFTTPPEAPAKRVLKRFAKRHGLQSQRSRVSGEYGGREVRVSLDKTSGKIKLRALSLRRLDMGLAVGREPIPGDARTEVRLGNATFDEAYRVQADDRQRAVQLMTPRLQQRLLDEGGRLDDEGVELLLSLPHDADRLDDAESPSDQAMSHALEQVCQTAAELDRASNLVACADKLKKVRSHWLEFAGQNNLASRDTPLSLWGKLEGVSVRAVAVRDAYQHYHFELTAGFPETFDYDLELKPAGATAQLDHTGPVVQPFEQAFSVTTRNPTDAARLISPWTRQALLELRRRGLQLKAHDEGLWAWLGFNPGDLPMATDGLRQLAAVAAKISETAQRS